MPNSEDAEAISDSGALVRASQKNLRGSLQPDLRYGEQLPGCVWGTPVRKDRLTVTRERSNMSYERNYSSLSSAKLARFSQDARAGAG
jgi:hypothetical protein